MAKVAKVLSITEWCSGALPHTEVALVRVGQLCVATLAVILQGEGAHGWQVCGANGRVAAKGTRRSTLDARSSAENAALTLLTPLAAPSCRGEVGFHRVAFKPRTP